MTTTSPPKAAERDALRASIPDLMQEPVPVYRAEDAARGWVVCANIAHRVRAQ